MRWLVLYKMVIYWELLAIDWYSTCMSIAHLDVQLIYFSFRCTGVIKTTTVYEKTTWKAGLYVRIGPLCSSQCKTHTTTSLGIPLKWHSAMVFVCIKVSSAPKTCQCYEKIWIYVGTPKKKVEMRPYVYVHLSGQAYLNVQNSSSVERSLGLSNSQCKDLQYVAPHCLHCFVGKR